MHAPEIWRDLYLLCNYVSTWEIKILVGISLHFPPSRPPPPCLLTCPQEELLEQKGIVV